MPVSSPEACKQVLRAMGEARVVTASEAGERGVEQPRLSLPPSTELCRAPQPRAISLSAPVKGKEGLGPGARSRGRQTWVRILTLSLADYVTLGKFPPPSQSLSFSAAKCEDRSTWLIHRELRHVMSRKCSMPHLPCRKYMFCCWFKFLFTF